MTKFMNFYRGAGVIVQTTIAAAIRKEPARPGNENLKVALQEIKAALQEESDPEARRDLAQAGIIINRLFMRR